MDSLHAPWRIEYILAPKPPPNGVSLFTRIAQSSDDEANHVLARDRTCFALLNTYPYTGGHLMVVPYRQVPDFNGLTDDELRDLLLLTRRCQNALAQVMKPDGFNVGINLGKVALVTGSTEGIGFAIARGLHDAGAEVIINGRTGQKVDAAVTRSAPGRAAMRSTLPAPTGVEH